MKVDLTLYHNSFSPYVSGNSRGSKWTLSYDTALAVSPTTGNVNMLWGNGSTYVFSRNPNGSYTPPPGIHQTLVANGSNPPTSFDLTDKSQTKYHLPYYSSASAYFLTTISDENGNTITVDRASGGAISGVHDSTTRILQIGTNQGYNTFATDAVGHKWYFNYDGNGNLSQVVDPVINGNAYSVRMGYDGKHNITSFTDRNNNTSTASFNTDNTIAWEKDAYGSQTSFAFGSPTSSATTITDANGHSIVHYYVGGRLDHVVDALSNIEYYTYDTDNNVTLWKDRGGQLWNYSYDGNGNVLTATDPLSHTTTYTYNADNKPLTAAAPSGRSVAGTYDANDNLTKMQEKDAAGNVKATTSYTIGSYGLVSDKTDANLHKTLYTYDGNGYLNSVTTPLGRQTNWTYDALGFQLSRTDAMRRKTTYTPDAWERNTQTSYPDGTANTYGYDANSNLTAFANYAASFTRTYDADDRLLAEAFSGIRHFSHTYDAAGQKGLLSTTADYDGRVITYAYSARNELASVGDSGGTTSYVYDVNGRRTRVFNPNGSRVDEYYNPDGSVHNCYDWNGQSTIFASFGYAYNADGQITGENEGTSTNTDTLPGPTQTTYGYDAQGHLTSEGRTGTNPLSHTYGFDPAGNRTLFYDGNSSPQTYDNDDEPTGAGGPNAFVLGYNANGDRTSESINGSLTTAFGYDFDDQLVSITKSGTSAGYVYDAIGRQLSKTVNGVLTIYYFDGGQVILEKQGGANTAQYLWGNGLVRCNGEYPLTDGRVSVRLSTNATQQVTSSNQPDAFGIGSVTGGTASAYSYGGAAGYRQDGISPAGLPGAYAFQKVGARYYDPTFECFLTRDTDLSQKAYAYCDGDPVNFSDPSGHKPPVHKKPGQPNSGTHTPSGPGPTGGGSGGGGSTGGGSAFPGQGGGGFHSTDEQKVLAATVGGVIGNAVKVKMGNGYLGAVAGSAVGYLFLKLEENWQDIAREGAPQDPINAMPRGF